MRKISDSIQAFNMNRDNKVFYIKTEDFYKDISTNVEEYFNILSYEASKGEIELGLKRKVIGKLKDETGDGVISKFCANRSKLYSFKVNNEGRSKNTLKGIVTTARETIIRFNDYTSCVFEVESAKQTGVETDEHVIRTVTRTKIPLEEKKQITRV